ncbi:MAG TPA: NHLP leader peptide family RiPP precursor [Acidimicrobiales bacterium]|nr:NHLP leader peptide family RiPP precursor [Acidimicrobiales bacterium]
MASTLQDIQHKAAVDLDFRAALTAEPRATLAAEGIEVPEGMTIEIVEARLDHLPIVIPPVQSGELTDDALDAVVGGAAATPSILM